MDKQKEIEEMARIIEFCTHKDCESCRKQGNYRCSAYNKATDLVNAGYGNVKKAVREFAEELKKKIKTFTVGSDEDELFKFGFETLAEHLPEEIDNLVDELYGDISCETCLENNNAEYNKRNCPNKGNCRR